MRLIAERAGIVTYIIEYQLAPEAKYPTQIDEIEYVVHWLFDQAAEQGVDPAKIGVGGDSAGGNMTCVIALKLRDENGPRLALQVPLFPEAAFPADTLAASENRSGCTWSPTASSRWSATSSRTRTTSGSPTSRP